MDEVIKPKVELSLKRGPFIFQLPEGSDPEDSKAFGELVTKAIKNKQNLVLDPKVKVFALADMEEPKKEEVKPVEPAKVEPVKTEIVQPVAEPVKVESIKVEPQPTVPVNGGK